MPHLIRLVPNDDSPPPRVRQLYDAFASRRVSAASVRCRFEVERDADNWTFELADDFFAELARGPCSALLREDHGDSFIELGWTSAEVTVALRLPSRPELDALMRHISDHDVREALNQPLRVFLGHGRDHQWRALRDQLQDHPGIQVLTYESDAIAGDPAALVLDRMAEGVDAAVLLHTAERREDGGWRYAAPNVVHETGFFQGRLGWNRTLIVREDGCRTFENIAGLTQVAFDSGKVRECFGDVVAFLRKTERRTRGSGKSSVTDSRPDLIGRP